LVAQSLIRLQSKFHEPEGLNRRFVSLRSEFADFRMELCATNAGSKVIRPLWAVSISATL
jgi:hypothetical protein